ncbi:MAG: hypothetical protein LIO59_01325 [Oscillospiraceae bacterium]|nr:hypothetical protein [Oscillospiraceae bacterium]
MRVLISLVIFFYIARMVCYGIYTFKDKNITGGVFLMILSALTLSVSSICIIDILK